MMISVSGPLALKWQWQLRAKPLNPTLAFNPAITTMRLFLFFSLFLVPFTTVLAQVSSATL
jgi:hypothetical protein